MVSLIPSKDYVNLQDQKRFDSVLISLVRIKHKTHPPAFFLLSINYQMSYFPCCVSTHPYGLVLIYLIAREVKNILVNLCYLPESLYY
jgi:hypothetical protein